MTDRATFVLTATPDRLTRRGSEVSEILDFFNARGGGWFCKSLKAIPTRFSEEVEEPHDKETGDDSDDEDEEMGIEDLHSEDHEEELGTWARVDSADGNLVEFLRIGMMPNERQRSSSTLLT